MLRASPVRGFLPVRALRLRASKVPKPISCTFLPAATSSFTVSNNALTAFSTSFLVKPAFSATAVINSVLFILKSPLLIRVLIAQYLRLSSNTFKHGNSPKYRIQRLNFFQKMFS